MAIHTVGFSERRIRSLYVKCHFEGSLYQLFAFIFVMEAGRKLVNGIAEEKKGSGGRRQGRARVLSGWRRQNGALQQRGQKELGARFG